MALLKHYSWNGFQIKLVTGSKFQEKFDKG
jgi:hypothetical protein